MNIDIELLRAILGEQALQIIVLQSQLKAVQAQVSDDKSKQTEKPAAE